jgi:hypothetical protein
LSPSSSRFVGRTYAPSRSKRRATLAQRRKSMILT